MKKTFSGNGKDFSSFYEACKWLEENGYSYGSMQRGSPIGVMKGSHEISKWRNLSENDMNSLDGRMMTSRGGETTVSIGEAL